MPIRLLSHPLNNFFCLWEEVLIFFKIEKRRFESGFEYQIDVPKELEDKLIPALILQPFVENSIWHGFPLKEGEKKINLNVTTTNEHINFELVDNGIGLKKSIELDKLNLYKEKGVATDSAIYRINNIFNYKNIIVDRSDISNTTTTGTRVFISFPKMRTNINRRMPIA